MRWIGCRGPARQIDPVDRSGFPEFLQVSGL